MPDDRHQRAEQGCQRRTITTRVGIKESSSDDKCQDKEEGDLRKPVGQVGKLLDISDDLNLQVVAFIFRPDVLKDMGEILEIHGLTRVRVGRQNGQGNH